MHDLKHLTRSKPNLLIRHWKTVLVSTLLVLLVVPLIRKAAQAVSTWQAARQPQQAVAVRQPLQLGDELYSVADSLLSTAAPGERRLTATAEDGSLLTYSINPRLQQQLDAYLAQTRPAYAVLVALEPSSGRVLALTGYSSLDRQWSRNAAYQVYPMASLFKMVTAAAALELGKVNPSTVLEFRGRLVSESPAGWAPHPRGRNHRMDLTEAMGKSVNPVYGLVASEYVGKDQLQKVCNRFGFNRSLLLPGVPAVPSPAPVPATLHDLRLQGCGLDHGLRISPIHAAAITAAIANQGQMMAPRLVDQVEREGKALKLQPPRPLLRVVEPATADSLTQMLQTSVTSGTARKAFHTPEGRRLLAGMRIAAKTGSIDGDSPRGHYSWFAAYAPADRPQIALAALVINGDKWRIKASHLGERALSEYFRQER